MSALGEEQKAFPAPVSKVKTTGPRGRRLVLLHQTQRNALNFSVASKPVQGFDGSAVGTSRMNKYLLFLCNPNEQSDGEQEVLHVGGRVRAVCGLSLQGSKRLVEVEQMCFLV